MFAGSSRWWIAGRGAGRPWRKRACGCSPSSTGGISSARRIEGRALLALLAAALTGCSSVGRVGEEGLRPTDVEYRQVLHRFTRHQALYQGLQRRLIWAATLEAPRFREVRSRAYASLLRMTQA